MLVIFFRGRNPAGIIEDARNEGILQDGDKVVIVCRENDNLAQPGDVTSVELPKVEPVTLVANGGTTAQVVPLIVNIVKNCSHAMIADLQRDGLKILYRQGMASRSSIARGWGVNDE
jgi:hypothetical protein